MKKTVQVTFTVDVEVDETKFTEDFIEAYKSVFYDFYDIDEHIKNLAINKCAGLADEGYLEGYGNLSEMGIKINNESCEAEILGDTD